MDTKEIIETVATVIGLLLASDTVVGALIPDKWIKYIGLFRMAFRKAKGLKKDGTNNS